MKSCLPFDVQISLEKKMKKSTHKDKNPSACHKLKIESLVSADLDLDTKIA
jgi:hypothetical protein